MFPRCSPGSLFFIQGAGFSFRDTIVSKQKEVRIVITKNKTDLKSEMATYEPATGKLTTFGTAGPGEPFPEL